MNRRHFIMLCGAAMVPLNASAQAPAALRVRRSALALPANDPVFAQYAAAVKKMHELPKDNPRSWWSQSKIHPDRCAHGTLSFLPWHRHYITFFEQICGELIGDPQFALPYWDWSFQRGRIPDAFFDLPELNVEHWRDPGVYNAPDNWGPVDSLPARGMVRGEGVQDDPLRGGAFTTETINSILQETTFSRFYRRLEQTPHNTGHVRVGALASGQRGHMVDGLSPLDPLFWLHHCNIDRLWAEWQTARNTTPVFDVTYQQHFVDKSGQSVNVTADSSKDFVAMGFTYETLGDPRMLAVNAGIVDVQNAWAGPLFERLAPVEIAPNSETVGANKTKQQAETGIATAVTVQVPSLKAALKTESTVLDATLPPMTSQKFDLGPKMLTQFGKKKRQLRRILARVTGIKGDFTQDPLVNVFVNCPYLTPETPYSDKHFAGTFAFFGARKRANAEGHAHAGHDHGKTDELFIDLTKALRAQNLDALEKVDVQFMVVAPKGGEKNAKITFESVEILTV